MSLWSLTQERVEKLRRQIGEIETEIDALIKLSKEDLWRKDLDLFIEEWRAQLDEEHKRKRRINNMGRRGSRKVTVAASGPAAKKRKGADWDDDDDDFEVAPKARKAAAPKANRKEVYVKKSQALLPSMLSSGQGTMGKNLARQVDGNSSEPEPIGDLGAVPDPAPSESVAPNMSAAMRKDESDDPLKVNKTNTVVRKEKPAPKVKEKPAPKSKAAKAERTKIKIDEDEKEGEEDGMPSRPAPRQARAAASKPIRYDIGSDSEDSNGDDLLGDITSMVKGLPSNGASSKASTDGKSLFSASRAKPIGGSSSSSAGQDNALSRGNSAMGKLGLSQSSRKSYAEPSDNDDTNFMGLVPQQSPRKSVSVTKNADLMDEDEEEDEHADEADGVRAPLTKTGKSQSLKGRDVNVRYGQDRDRERNKDDADVDADEDEEEEDDDDDDDDIPIPSKAKFKAQIEKPTASAAATTTTTTVKKPASNAKAGPKAKPTSKSTTTSTKTLSPAAKAYQAKQARSMLLDQKQKQKQQQKPKSTKKKVVDSDSDDDDENDALDAMADDLLDSDSDSDPHGDGNGDIDIEMDDNANADTKKQESGINNNSNNNNGRPARRAAAAGPATAKSGNNKKPVYTFSSSGSSGDDDDDDDDDGGGW